MTKIVFVCASTGMYLCSVCTSGFNGETCNSENVNYYRKIQDKASERLSNSLFNNVMNTHFSFLIFDLVNELCSSLWLQHWGYFSAYTKILVAIWLHFVCALL